MIDVEAHDLAVGREVDVESLRDLARFHARAGLELDIETIGFGILMQLHG